MDKTRDHSIERVLDDIFSFATESENKSDVSLSRAENFFSMKETSGSHNIDESYSSMTSDISYQEPFPKLSNNKSGRKKNKFTSVLENFFTCNSRHPKKEFFNAFMIRSIKRAFRYIELGRVPSNTNIAIDCNDGKQVKIWEEVKYIYLNGPSFVKKIAATDSGPVTDGKSKRKKELNSSKFKSFNNQYCRDFFKSSILRKAFFLIFELMICNFDPSVLKVKFKFYCCLSDTHGVECYKSWIGLKEYLITKYFKDLDVEGLDACLDESHYGV